MFDIQVTQKTVYTCADNSMFETREEAEQHNKVLETKEKERVKLERLNNTIESYINSQVGWSDRKRAQARAMLTPFFTWYQGWDRQFIAPTVQEVQDEAVETVIDEPEQEEYIPF
jgi:hypothetical protein